MWQSGLCIMEGTEQRVQAVCELFVCNDLDKLAQLAIADDPSTWLRASEFSLEELQFVRTLAPRRKRQRSRSTSVGFRPNVHAGCVSLFRSNAGRQSDRAPVADAIRRGAVDEVQERPRNCTSEFMGPRAVIRRLDLASWPADEKQAWVENARIDAILGSCRRTMPSVKSGIRCWTSFMGMITYFMWMLSSRSTCVCDSCQIH